MENVDKINLSAFFMSWTHSFYGIMLFQMDINLSFGTELSAIKPYVSAI